MLVAGFDGPTIWKAEKIHSRMVSSMDKKKDFLTHEHLRTMPICGMQALSDSLSYEIWISWMALSSDNNFCNHNIL